MFKLNIKYEINGREVSSDNFGDELLAAAVADVIAQGKTLIDGVSCPTHGTRPTNVEAKVVGEKIEWLYLACCEAHKSAIEAKLQEE